MTFFTRVSLDDIQVKQLTGDTLTMSGVTDFVGTLKSKSIEIDASTGGTGNTGHVLTYSAGTITLKPNAAVGTGVYNSNRTITRSSTPPSLAGNVNGSTVSEFLDGFFFPDVPPTGSLDFFSGATTREFGDQTDTTTGDYFFWSATQQTNPINTSGITVVVNGTGTQYDATGGTSGTTGTTSYQVIASNYSPATGTTQQITGFTMTILTASDQTDLEENITWRHKVHWFKDSTKYTNTTGNTIIIEGILNTGTTEGSALSTVKTKSFTITFNDEYFYYVYPKQFGTPIFTVNGIKNNAWGHSSDTLFQMDYTNVNSYTEQFYVASSDNKITGSYTISCT